jgi:hypothetical protein
MKSFVATQEETMWHTRINKALEWRKKYSFERNWPIIDEYYRHEFNDLTDRPRPRFNLIYIMGQTLIPNLVFQSPGILNRASRDDMVFMASLWDSIDNWWIRHCEMREVAKELVLSSFLHNTTLSQIGYDFDDEASQVRRKVEDVKSEDKEVFRDVEGSINRTRAYNAPWVDSIPSHRGIVAVGTRTMRNCLWAGKLVSIPTRILKGQKGLQNVRCTKLPQEVLDMERHTWSLKEQDKWTHFWEIHEAESGKVFWLGTHGKFILPPTEDPLQVYGLPFEVLSFNRNDDTVYGTPDAEYIRTQQLEGDEVRKDSMFMRRFSLPKFVYDSNVIKPADVEKMLSNQVAPGIPAQLGEGGEDDLRKHLYVFTPPTSLMLHREYAKDLLNDAQLINGFGPNQMGTFAPGRRTKYEAQVVESNNTTRLAYRRNDVANVIQGHVHRANILMSKYWTGEIVQQVVGVDGAMYWVKVNAATLGQLQDGLVTEVNVESLAPVSRERRKMEAANLLSMLGGMQEAGVNTLPLIKQLLSAYEWLDVSQILPQMSGEVEMAHWEEQQRKLIQEGGLGDKISRNMQGVRTLGGGLPAEPMMQTGEEDGQNRADYSNLQ